MAEDGSTTPGRATVGVIAARVETQLNQQALKRKFDFEEGAARRIARRSSKPLPEGGWMEDDHRERIRVIKLPPLGNASNATFLRVNPTYVPPKVCERLCMRARIGKTYAACPISDILAAYLRRVGFEVIVDDSAEQVGVTCAIVAARYLVDSVKAKDIFAASLARAVEKRWLRMANRSLSLFTEAEMQGHVLFGDETAYRLGCGEPTRYLNGEELQRCLRLFWEMTNEEMKASNMKGGDSGDVFDVHSVDGALAILAKDLRAAQEGIADHAQRFIAVSNGTTATKRGWHWCPLVYEIRPKSGGVRE